VIVPILLLTLWGYLTTCLSGLAVAAGFSTYDWHWTFLEALLACCLPYPRHSQFCSFNCSFFLSLSYLCFISGPLDLAFLQHIDLLHGDYTRTRSFFQQPFFLNVLLCYHNVTPATYPPTVCLTPHLPICILPLSSIGDPAQPQPHPLCVFFPPHPGIGLPPISRTFSIFDFVSIFPAVGFILLLPHWEPYTPWSITWSYCCHPVLILSHTPHEMKEWLRLDRSRFLCPLHATPTHTSKLPWPLPEVHHFFCSLRFLSPALFTKNFYPPPPSSGKFCVLATVRPSVFPFFVNLSSAA